MRTTVRSLSRVDAARGAVAGQVDPQERLSFSTADLLEDTGWKDAVRDCDYVIHVASPMARVSQRRTLAPRRVRERFAFSGRLKRLVSDALCSLPPPSPRSVLRSRRKQGVRSIEDVGGTRSMGVCGTVSRQVGVDDHYAGHDSRTCND